MVLCGESLAEKGFSLDSGRDVVALVARSGTGNSVFFPRESEHAQIILSVEIGPDGVEGGGSEVA